MKVKILIVLLVVGAIMGCSEKSTEEGVKEFTYPEYYVYEKAKIDHCVTWQEDAWYAHKNAERDWIRLECVKLESDVEEKLTKLAELGEKIIMPEVEDRSAWTFDVTTASLPESKTCVMVNHHEKTVTIYDDDGEVTGVYDAPCLPDSY